MATFINFPLVVPTRVETFMTTAAGQGLQNLFTINIPVVGNGNINFGYIDHQEYAGEIRYTDTSGSQWSIRGNGFSIGNSNPRGLHGNARRITFDTGATSTYLPQDLVTRFYERIPGFQIHNGYYIVHPDAVFPDIQIHIGDYTLRIVGTQMRRSPAVGGK